MKASNDSLARVLLQLSLIVIGFFGVVALQLPIFRYLAQDLIAILPSLEDYAAEMDAEIVDGLFAIKGFAPSPSPQSLTNCSRIGTGWNKAVYRCGDRAVKIPNLEGVSFEGCLVDKRTSRSVHALCRRALVRSFLHEASMLARLQGDEAVPELLSVHCPVSSISPNSRISTCSLSMELGEPITMIMLAQMPWHERLSIVRQLLEFFSRHPHLRFNDLRRQQVILVNSSVAKIVDFDDVAEMREDHQLHEASLHHASRLYFDFLKGAVVQPEMERSFHALSDSHVRRSLTVAGLSEALGRLGKG